MANAWSRNSECGVESLISLSAHLDGLCGYPPSRQCGEQALATPGRGAEKCRSPLPRANKTKRSGAAAWGGGSQRFACPPVGGRALALGEASLALDAWGSARRQASSTPVQ